MQTNTLNVPTTHYTVTAPQAQHVGATHSAIADEAAVSSHIASTAQHETPAGYPKSSMTWVNYQHGVNLAEAIEPGSSKRMSREELIAYAAKMNAESVTNEQALLIAGTRVGPALEWAVANGVLTQKTNYGQEDVHTALSALDQHLSEMEQAVGSLATPSPLRKNYFIGSEMYSAHDIKDKSEQYKKYPVAVYDEKKFDADFKADLESKKAAYGTVIKHLISTLPMEERRALEYGQVGIYALKPAVSGAEREREIFVMKVIHNGQTTVYEVNPQQGTINRRDHYKKLFTGTAVIGRKTTTEGAAAGEFTVWDRPNTQALKYQPTVDRQNSRLPNNEPFHSALYVLEPVGELTKPLADNNQQAAPNTLTSRRFSDIANIVSSTLFYVKEDDLLTLAKDDPERVTAQETKDREYVKNRKGLGKVLKGFVPFWSGIEALVAGRTIEGVSRIWIDILSSMLPVEKALGSLIKSGTRLIKSALPKFAKLTNNFANYSFKPGIRGVDWKDGVQGLTWSPRASTNVSKGIAQFRLNGLDLPRFNPGVREIEFNGAKYFVADKPDAGDGVHYLLRVAKPDDPTQLVSSGKIARPDDAGVWVRRGVIGGGRKTDTLGATRQQLQAQLNDIKITDIPTLNENGVVQYKHDGNHLAVIQRRDQLRKELQLDNYGAVRSETFQTRLAQRVRSERDANGKIFGQCAEMAAYAADTIKQSAKDAGYRTYMVQIPSTNHTVVLLSRNSYSAGAKIDWAKEFAADSITVDLWQGVLSKENPAVGEVISNTSKKHLYTKHKPAATVQVEMKVH